MAKKKKPNTAFGWMEEIETIMRNARYEISQCVTEAQHLIGVEVDFLDEEGKSLMATTFNPRQCVRTDERGDMTILLNGIPKNVAAIKLAQYGK